MCKYGGVTNFYSVFYWLEMEKGGPGSTKKKATEMSKVSIHWMSDLPIYVGCGCSPCHPTPGPTSSPGIQKRMFCYVFTSFRLLYLYIQIYETSEVKNLPSMLHYVSICWRAWVLGWKLSKTNFTFWICWRRFWRSRIEVKFIKKTISLQFHQ